MCIYSMLCVGEFEAGCSCVLVGMSVGVCVGLLWMECCTKLLDVRSTSLVTLLVTVTSSSLVQHSLSPAPTTPALVSASRPAFSVVYHPASCALL